MGKKMTNQSENIELQSADLKKMEILLFTYTMQVQKGRLTYSFAVVMLKTTAKLKFLARKF